MARSLEAQEAEFELIPVPPLEEDWLELRRDVRWWNASLAGCLVPDSESKTGCKHPWVTVGDACTEKLRPDFEVAYDEDRQRLFKRGNDMEPYVAAMAAEMTGLKLVKADRMSRRGPILSTPDFLAQDRDDVGVEVKTRGREFLGPVCPAYWHLQGQLQCWTEDWERVWIAALDATLEVTLYEVMRDDDLIRSLVSRAQFYLDCLSIGEVPPGVRLSAGNVSTLWPRSEETTADLPAEMLGPLNDYLIARAEEKDAKARKEAARDEIVTLMGANAIAAIGQVEVATFRAAKDRQVFDYKRLAREHPDWAEQYTDTKPGVRSFNIKDKGVTAMINALGGVNDDEAIDW